MVCALIVCGFSGAASDAPRLAAPQPTVNTTAEVRIDSANQHQTLEGFGASHQSLWRGPGRGDPLGPLRATALEAAYNQVHLTTGNLDAILLESPGDYSQRANDDSDPFHINWSGFQHDTLDATKALLLDLAQPYGFTDYYTGQRINVRFTSPWLGDIRRRDYDRYLDEAAEQVAAGLIYLRDTYGIVTPYNELFNEPLSGNGELGDGNVQDMIDLIKRVGERLRREGFSEMKFVISNEETEEKSLRAATAILADPSARQYVGAIGYHTYPYGSVYADVGNVLRTSGAGRPDPSRIAVRGQLRDLGKQYGIPVWMTEVCCGGVPPLSYEAFLGRAIHIHDELIYADAAAYYALVNLSDTTADRHSDTALSDEGSVILIDNATGAVHVSGLGYAIGHYARFLGRGAIRVEATSSDPLLEVVSFLDRGRIVTMLINSAPAERTVNVSIEGVVLSADLTGEQSTAAAYWQPVGPVTPTNVSGFTLAVPAKSVTTLAGLETDSLAPNPA